MQRYPDFSLCFERLPWRTFADQLNTILRPTDGTSELLSASSGSLHPAARLAMNLRVKGADINLAKIRTERYLPTQCALIPETETEPGYSLTTKDTQLELLKHLVGIISNCHDEHDSKMRKFLELAENKTNLKFIGRLFSMKEVAIRAFAEKILGFSFDYRKILFFSSDYRYSKPNIALVKVILESGADVNWRNSDGESLLEMLFECLREIGRYVPRNFYVPRNATELRLKCEKLILELFARGANWSKPEASLRAIYHVPPSPLDLLIQYAGQNTVYKFLDMIRASQENCHYITTGIFVITSYRGNVELFQKLSFFSPTVVAELKRSPWLLFEAAALGDNISMVKHLQEVGFDLTSTDPHGKGNPLVFACNASSPSGETFQYLLGTGVSINQYANGAFLRFLDLSDHVFSRAKLYFNEVFGNTAPIHAAVIGGSQVQVEDLLRNGADPNQYGKAFPLQLVTFNAEEDCVEITRLLLEAGANPNLAKKSLLGLGSEQELPTYKRDILDHSAILHAVEFNELEILQILINAGAELPIPPLCTCDPRPEQHDTDNGMCAYNDEDQWNLLLLAESEELFSYLLEIAPMWLKVHWVSRRCFSKALKTLKWEFVSEHFFTGTFPESVIDRQVLLAKAIANRDEHWVDFAIGIPNQSMIHGFIIAADTGQTEIVQAFLDMGLWPDDDGDLEALRLNIPATPLSKALSRHNEPRSMFLQHYRKHSHNPSPDDSVHLKNAYVIAICCGDIEFAEMAVAGGDVNDAKYIGLLPHMKCSWCSSPNLEFHSAVHIASAFKRHDTVQWLLAQGADPNISHDALTGPSSYHSPLQCAAKEGKTALVTALLEKGARVNDAPINANGATALQFAAIRGDFEMLKVLLDAGADINAPPSKWDGRTAIEGAAEWGRLYMVSLLMEAGADIQGRENVNYRRTVYRAWVHGHHVLAEMVQQWKSQRYGEDDCVTIESIIQSIGMEELGCAEQDRLQLPDPENPYYDPCEVCERECIWA